MDGSIPGKDTLFLLRELEEEVYFAYDVVKSLYPSPESERSSQQQLMAYVDLLGRFETLKELYVQHAISNPGYGFDGAIEHNDERIKYLRRNIESIFEGKDVLSRRKKVAKNIEAHISSKIPGMLDSLESDWKELRSKAPYHGIAQDIFAHHERIANAKLMIEQYCQFFHHEHNYNQMIEHSKRMAWIVKEFEDFTFGVNKGPSTFKQIEHKKQ